jgi:hypothetical protein
LSRKKHKDRHAKARLDWRSATQLADTILTLVADDGGNTFSIPQFYRDGVLFTRSNILWRVDLTGSNVTRLFSRDRVKTCNGEVLAAALAVPPTGPIGLEADRGQMEYRRIRIMELP